MKTKIAALLASAFIASTAHASPESDANIVFDWAERAYASLFNPPVPSSENMYDYTYRCYQTTVCLVEQNSKLYLYQDNQLFYVGLVQHYLDGIHKYNVVITGDFAFVAKIKSVMDLLEEKSPETYARVVQYVGEIKQGEYSRMWANQAIPTYEIGPETATADLVWLAGTVAHDATHSKLFNDYAQDHLGKYVPADVWTGVSGETKCLEYQLMTLQDLGAQAYQINYVVELIRTQEPYWLKPVRAAKK